MGRGLAAALLAGALLALPAPAGARAAAPSKCLTDNATWRGRSILPELRRLGVRVWTSGLPWADVAPTRPANPGDPADPAYHWPADLDARLDEARGLGVDPVLYVNTTPPWANGGRTAEWAPEDPGDYAAFMAAAVLRYPQVRRWQVVSEPGKGANFMPQGGAGRMAPRRYARILDAAYGAMHAARRDVVVIGGNLHPTGGNDEFSTAPPTFIANMRLPDGRRPRLDLFGMNPYSERRPDLAERQEGNRVDLNDLDWLLRRLDAAYPGRRLKVFVSEFGWQTEHGNDQWFWFVPRPQQAADLRAAYRLAAQVGRVDTFCWFQLYDSPPAKHGPFFANWTSGLRTWTGYPKPSYRAFRRVASGPQRVPAPPLGATTSAAGPRHSP
jgi:hypothetical protein